MNLISCLVSKLDPADFLKNLEDIYIKSSTPEKALLWVILSFQFEVKKET